MVSEKELEKLNNLIDDLHKLTDKISVASDNNKTSTSIYNQKSIDRLENFKNLKKNWNGYGANPIDLKVINNARKILDYLEFNVNVLPMAYGNIKIELKINPFRYIEFEICDDGMYWYEIRTEDSFFFRC